MVKNKIRKSLFDQGQLLSDKFLLETSSKIQKNVIEEIDIESSKNTLLYFPYKKEIKLNLIINEIKSYSNNIYLPKIFPNKELRFNLLSDESIMVKNKYGISEIDDNKNYIGLEGFNMIFIPFVGVDKNGYRLGYGGGYFDRAIEKIKLCVSKPLVLGIGYDYQVMNISFGESHDMKYDTVITESRVLSYK